MDDQNGIERRQYRRVDARVRVSIQKYDEREKGLSSEHGTSRNVSAGGLLLHHDKPVEVPSYIIAAFSLPDSGEELNFVGKVVRVEELLSGGYEIGVMFMRMILGDFEEVEKYVSDVAEES
jgi:c-di-GMP-binding flagellar brake protein YcgR